MNTEKIALIAAATIISVGAVSLGTVGIIKHNSIGEYKAEQIALSDSGTAISDARFRKTDFDFEDGHFVYEVEFYTDNGEYEYTISAKNGDIISRDADIIKLSENNTSPAPPVASDVRIDLETAKNTALSDAGVNVADVIFTKEKLDRDDGLNVYEIEFRTAATEYEYKILASDGTIIEYEID